MDLNQIIEMILWLYVVPMVGTLGLAAYAEFHPDDPDVIGYHESSNPMNGVLVLIIIAFIPAANWVGLGELFTKLYKRLLE